MDKMPENEYDRNIKKFTEEIGKKEVRKIKGRKEKEQKSTWFGMGMMGVVGWSVTVPTIVCIAIGIWLDKKWPGTISWTLTLLFIGIGLGCLNAWYWIKAESRKD